ncbi:metal-sensing transcriptional repressor [Aliiroseovarius sp. F20344]|uniref:metal-sensing transcriptional repressor n=1 Tax=Aliiroseovarius sp. F20344 TaxID=2926414 RepID=UPI001FF3F900|nr:metal-sensing transcriptional repressor [Aliiroseovarius sp. F20344]MCK0143464.1 metal-sensing transcriptional repressor [Aliiroseovarius sp. F20344]
MDKPHTHSSHPKIAARLKRAYGHLQSVIEMIEQGRPCVDLAQQLQAVESAIRNTKQALIHDHLDHCLGDETAPAVAELKAITRYL